MKTDHDIIREHIMQVKGIDQSRNCPSLEELKATQWSPSFERLIRNLEPKIQLDTFLQLMKNRLIMGSFRHGLLKSPTKLQYYRIDSIRERVARFESTGNAEDLVDAGNCCLLEFEEGEGPTFVPSVNGNLSYFSSYKQLDNLLSLFEEYKKLTGSRNARALAVCCYLLAKEYEEKTHPNWHFEAKDDKDHTRYKE